MDYCNDELTYSFSGVSLSSHLGNRMHILLAQMLSFSYHAWRGILSFYSPSILTKLP